MKLMTYNIQEGGEDFLEELTAVLEQAAPDIVAIEEANDEYVFESLAARLGFEHVLGEGRRGFHVGVLSRYAILTSQNHADRGEFFHTMLQVQLATPGRPTSLFAAHLYPGYGPAFEQRRVEEVAAILRYMEPERDNPCLLVGDFNALSPQDRLNLDDWPLHWRVQILAQGGEIGRDAIRAVLESGLTDCFRAKFPDATAYPGYTLPATDPNVRLDYIFANRLLLEKLQSCQVWYADPAPVASDHLPLVAEFEEFGE